MPSLSSFFEDNKPLASVIILAALLALIIVVFLLYRVVFGRRLRTATGGRARQPRLGMVDAFDLDRQRQLVLIRRDNVEHLIMIGGPNDIVIESSIVRTLSAAAPGPNREKDTPQLAATPAAQPVLSGPPPIAASPVFPQQAPAPAIPAQIPANVQPAPPSPYAPPPAAANGPGERFAARPPAPAEGAAPNGNPPSAPRAAQTSPPSRTGFVPGQRSAPQAPPAPRPVQGPIGAQPRPAPPAAPPRPAPPPPRPSLASSLPPRPVRPVNTPPLRSEPQPPPLPGQSREGGAPGESAHVPDIAPPLLPEGNGRSAPEPMRPSPIEPDIQRPGPSSATKGLDTLESLEEEMAKLLGRPTTRRDG